MLADERVRSELEMVDEQYEELKKLNAQIQQRLAEQISNLDLSDRKNLASRLHDMREQARAELNSLLLPHQVDRLRQIRLQNQLRHHSLADVLGSEPLKTLLEISDAQSRELREAERQIEEELAKEIARLREKARDRLLSRLKPRQRSNLKQMLGDSFDSVNAKAATRSGDTKDSPDG
jgi:hypothetical protein